MNNYLSRIATKTIMKLTPKTSQLETLSMSLQLKSVQTSNEAFFLVSHKPQTSLNLSSFIPKLYVYQVTIASGYPISNRPSSSEKLIST